jgi:hypothetical protein
LRITEVHVSKPRRDFIWPKPDEADALASIATVAQHYDVSPASAARDPECPPGIRIGHLVRYSCHAWDEVMQRRLAAAQAAAAAASAPVLPAPAPVAPIATEPPVRRKRGRPPGSKNKNRSVPTAAPMELEAP